jgi:lipopolysaccharide/colanic/teichoic acid biosynthesis glycosyltransferase
MHVRSQRGTSSGSVLSRSWSVLTVAPARTSDRPRHGSCTTDRVAQGRYVVLVKPALDQVAAAVLLAVLAPLLAVVALAVLVSLGRPVLLRQERVGLDESVFTLLKFRTMRPCRRSSADRRRAQLGVPECRRGEERRRTHKHPADPRLVPVGRFLRRWSLDELPQLVNVLRGEMSLVGPRPELPAVVSRYEPWQHERHAVRPGITGLWQVTDRGADGTLMHERTDVDLHYVRRVSPWLDLQLLLATVPAVLGLRRGV